MLSRKNLRFVYNIMPFGIRVLMASVYGYKKNLWRSHRREEFVNILRKRDGWSTIQWQRWQQCELEHRLIIAAKKVPYYRDYWAKIEDADHKKKRDLKNWPILTKDILRQNLVSFINEDYDVSDLEHIQTSGTSGKPMSHYFDKNSSSYWYAIFQVRAKNWHGLNEADWWANIGGQLVVPYSRKKPPFWVINYPMRQIYFSSYHISEENAEDYISRIRKSKVKYILGYTSSIYWLAYYGLEQNLSKPNVKAVLLNAEPLYDFQRKVIEAFFCCKVIETYSSSERAFGGNECEKGAMHYFPDAGFIEVLNEEDVSTGNETGRFVITGLVNDAMPLIRYDTGDLGSISWKHKCSCGRGMPLITEITGRLDDTLIGQDGRRIGRLDPVFKANLRISESQIIQRSIAHIVVNIVPEPGFNDEDKQTITDGLKQRLGDSVEVEFQLMKSIPRLNNGKFKAVISEI